MLILGLNAYHGDSSACLVHDGMLVCAIEEERIRRQKHWAGLPTESVRWCLEYAGATLGDVDYIAVSRNPSAHLHKKLLRVVRSIPSLGFLRARLQNASRIGDIKGGIALALDVDPSAVNARVMNVEHHRAHLASAFLVSPFEEAAVASVDGFGDFLSAMRGHGRGGGIGIADWVEYPHSLGILYTAITQHLGFWNYGDEYKVMGLSAFGDPEGARAVDRLVRVKGRGLFELDLHYFLHHTEGVDMVWEDGIPRLGRLFSDALTGLLGPPRAEGEEITQRHRDIAAALQASYEKVYFGLLRDLAEQTGLGKVALAGGCIQNSLANGKIYDQTPFEEVYIPPAAYDGGTSVGAAFWVWNIELGNPRGFVMHSACWGPEFDDGRIEAALRAGGLAYEKYGGETLVREVAGALSEGLVVGWFQGRTEWGPRSLGGRSILADPRNPRMKDILNARIKRREDFRPFAPSVLEERVGEWFERTEPVPFMEKVYPIRAGKRDLLPAVTNIDGTGRLQTVSRETSPRYHALITEFEGITGVPMVLNTSFNENEPIVNTPESAVECFLRTRMDMLVMGDFIVKREGAGEG